MPQIRPRIDEDIAADVQAYAGRRGISFNAAVNVLLRDRLDTIKGDGTDESNA